VNLVGDATADVAATQAQNILEQVRKEGFFGLCGEYLPHATDGPAYLTTLRIGDQIKTVKDDTPSSAPVWLRDVELQLDSLSAIQQWIGRKPS